MENLNKIITNLSYLGCVRVSGIGRSDMASSTTQTSEVGVYQSC